MGMGYEKTTTSLVRMKTASTDERRAREEEELAERAANVAYAGPDASAADNLRKLLRVRFGSCTRGWRDAVDCNRAHKVAREEFYEGMRKLGFTASSKQAWDELVGRKRDKAVTLADLDTSAAQAVSDFYRSYVEQMGPLSSLLEGSDGLRICQKTFLWKCSEMGMSKEELLRVWRNLETNGWLTENDCDWLDDYCARRPHVRERGRQAIPGEYEAKKEEKSRKRTTHEFKAALQHRYGGIVPAWRRALDPEGTGNVTNTRLMETATSIGFKGEPTDVWNELTAAGGYTIKLENMDDDIPRLLDDFKERCQERFGSMAKCFEDLDSVEKPFVTSEEFKRLCVEVNMAKNHNKLASFLDKENVGAILLEEIDADAAKKVFGVAALREATVQREELESRPERPNRMTLMERFREKASQDQDAHRDTHPEQRSALMNFTRHLTNKFGSPIRAWSAVFDKEGKGKLEKKEFLAACAATGFTGNANDIWDEFGLKEKASLRLKDFAPEAIDDVRRFKAHTLENLSDRRGFIVEDRSLNRKVSAPEFVELSKKAGLGGLGHKGANRVFNALDLDGEGHVMTKTLRWLHEAKSHDKAVHTVLSKHRDLKRKVWLKTLEAKKVKNKEVYLKHADSLLQAGRSKRSEKMEIQAFYKEFREHLRTKYGTIPAAWQLAIDADGNEELELMQFLAGLRKAEFLESDDTRTPLAEKLFAKLADKNTGVVTLACLDPDSANLIDQFRRGCVVRFGSMLAAFQDFDPETTGKVSAGTLTHACHRIGMSHLVFRFLAYLDPEGTGEISLDAIDDDAAAAAEDAAAEAEEKAEERAERDRELGRLHMTKLADDRSLKVASGVQARAAERALQPGQKIVHDFKAKLLQKHGTLLKAWRAMFSTETVELDEFKGACEDTGFEGDEVETAWRVLIGGGKGFRLKLEDFDPGIKKDVEDFKEKMLMRYGSFEAAFSQIESSEDLTIDEKRFLRLCYDCQFRGNEKRLFQYFDKENNNSVAFRNIDEKGLEKAQKLMAAEKSALEKIAADAARKQRRMNKKRGVKQREVVEEPPSTDSNTPAAAFRALLRRRFGSTVRAWRTMDRHGCCALTKNEFVASLGVTGYGGSPTLLWTSLVGDGTSITLRDVDPDAFELLSQFREVCAKRAGGLEGVFQKKTLGNAEFYEVCAEVEAPRPWEPVFQLLANAQGVVSWEEVRFLAEQWTWEADGTVRPIRRTAPPADLRPSGQYPGSPPRARGDGPLATSMRPLKVMPRRYTSLPEIVSPIRAQWNERHQIADMEGNKTEQLIHLMAYVNTQEQERIQKRVTLKMREESIEQFVELRKSGRALF